MPHTTPGNVRESLTFPVCILIRIRLVEITLQPIDGVVQNGKGALCPTMS